MFTESLPLLLDPMILLLLVFGVLALRRRFSAEWDELSAARQDLRLEASALAKAARRAEQSGDQ